ncbi:unnamed protein product [Alopecurus aequalis]
MELVYNKAIGKPITAYISSQVVITMSISFLQRMLISTLALLVVPLYFYFRRSSSRSKLPTNWPILYMFPSLLTNLHNLHDYLAAVLAGSGHSFRAHGPPGSGMRFFFTCNPDNVRHIFTTNRPNYPKGPEFAAIFDIMDGALFTLDGEPWRHPRMKVQNVLSSPRVVARMSTCCRDMLENNLLPRLIDVAGTGTPFDMQELMARFMFDLTATTLIGVDPGLMSSDMPPMDVSDAMDTVMEVGFVRHMMPAYCWKAMRWVNIGPERNLMVAHTVLRGFVAEMMEMRKKIEAGGHVGNDKEQEEVYILSSYITDPDYVGDDLFRATLLGFMLAGRDTIATTLPWIFYILAQRPDVVSTLRNELSPIASHKVAGMGLMVIFEPEETKALVYLGAVLYETLRLYPPGPFVRKTVLTDDSMPSGHVVKAGDTIIVSFHSIGRMENVWGEDCLDYNPDRWLSKDSGDKLRYVPSHKFLAFNSGPRICPGKDIAIMQMKTIVAAVVWNFNMEVVEGQTIQPKSSCLLQMKNGLKMMLKKRDI